MTAKRPPSETKAGVSCCGKGSGMDSRLHGNDISIRGELLSSAAGEDGNGSPRDARDDVPHYARDEVRKNTSSREARLCVGVFDAAIHSP
jgi:hypothetical protein